jgi:hypothetical protein
LDFGFWIGQGVQGFFKIEKGEDVLPGFILDLKHEIDEYATNLAGQ